MGPRHSRLAAALAAEWEAEVVSGRRLLGCAEAVGDPVVKARLLVLAAFCRAHASRILARLAALGRGPIPVPPDEEEGPGGPGPAFEGLSRARGVARAAASRYAVMADLARAMSDLSSAWVCELNRSEEEQLISELGEILANRYPEPQWARPTATKT
jgi:hypothetical protein